MIIQALDFYKKIDEDMFADIAKYFEHGYVFKTPQSLLLGKAVRTEDGDPVNQWNVTAPDAWFVKTAVGEVGIPEFIKRIPYPLPYVGWMRELKNKPIKWFKYSDIIRRIS